MLTLTRLAAAAAVLAAAHALAPYLLLLVGLELAGVAVFAWWFVARVVIARDGWQRPPVRYGAPRPAPSPSRA